MSVPFEDVKKYCNEIHELAKQVIEQEGQSNPTRCAAQKGKKVPLAQPEAA